MSLVEESSGTQTAVVGTEHQLAAPTTNKTRVLRVDCGNLANGDAVELYIKTKVLSGGTVRVQQVMTYANLMGSPIVESIPISSNQGATFTLKQTAGTARQFPWAVLTLD
jgi:hypothetical protein